ncbi:MULTISPECIES: ABC transporter ATP-binding protein [Aurantimonas]|uniref:ABC transporter ATP-binding protein n=1 Tax=Aurantimonas TaxID=182269 RepID=UPI00165D3E31
MARLILENVNVDIPIPSMRARSLRTVAIAKARAIGGQIINSGTEISVMRALENVSFSLKDGDRLGLVGPNGAGKTTLIRVLSDVYQPTAGVYRREGTLVPMLDLNLGFDDEATGSENIFMRGLMIGLSRKEIESRVEEISTFSELGEYLDLPLRTYSQGMRLRLMFAIAVTVSGDIVLMDEWISVGDESFKHKAQERLQEVIGRAGILVIASHDNAILRENCNLALRLEKGRITAFGPINEVIGEED